MAGIAQAHVQALAIVAGVPVGHPGRLALGQVAAHGERRVGHVERGAVGAGAFGFAAGFGGGGGGFFVGHGNRLGEGSDWLSPNGERGIRGGETACPEPVVGQQAASADGSKFDRAWSGGGFVRRPARAGSQKTRARRRSPGRCLG